MDPVLIKLGIQIVLMLASKHPQALLDILTKAGPELANNIEAIFRNIEVKSPSSYLDSQNREAQG